MTTRSHRRSWVPCAWVRLVLLTAAGCGRIGFGSTRPDLQFVDENQTEFDQGSYDTGHTRLAWLGDRVGFAIPPPYVPAEPGIYVSRPFDSGDDATRWDTLAWVPTAPEGRALPDGGGSDEGYAESGLDMTDNILLLHLDGASAADGDPVRDSSGAGHDGRMVFAGQGASYGPGVFGKAVDLQRDAWVTLDGNDFAYGTGDFTQAVWVKMYDCAESNDNRIAMGGQGQGNDPHVWIGANCPELCPGGDGAFMNLLDDVRNGPNLDACSGVVLTDGAWHLLAGVKQGHTAPPATVRLYVDGVEVASTNYDFGTETFTYDGGEVRLGSFNLNEPMYNTRVTVDEAAIWRRALDQSEIESLYRRGAVHLGLQFRVCPDRRCDTEPFVGPDGTSATMFSEADLAGPAGSQQGNLARLGLVGAVAQYLVVFSTDTQSMSPSLARVTVSAHAP